MKVFNLIINKIDVLINDKCMLKFYWCFLWNIFNGLDMNCI